MATLEHVSFHLLSVLLETLLRLLDKGGQLFDEDLSFVNLLKHVLAHGDLVAEFRKPLDLLVPAGQCLHRVLQYFQSRGLLNEDVYRGRLLLENLESAKEVGNQGLSICLERACHLLLDLSDHLCRDS